MPLSLGAAKFLTAGEVANLFGGKDVTWFYRNRRKLEGQGFPKPHLGGCYDPLAIYAWRLTQLSPALRAVIEAAQATGDGEPIRDYEAELRANAERIAGDLGARPRLVGNL
jgi:hypothetical protein